MKKGYIYKISNDVNNLVYIGQTLRDVNIRFHEHCFDNRKRTSLIHSAISKYGYQHFKIEIIEEVDYNLLDEREKYWINYYNSTDRNYGYNVSIGRKGIIIRDYNQIQIVENGLIVDSLEELSRIIEEKTSWSKGYVKSYIRNIINTDKTFCDYHFVYVNVSLDELSDISEVEEWILKLNIVYTGKKILCVENNVEFDTIADAAKYFIDNKQYTGNSKTPMQSLVTSISKNLRGKSTSVECIGNLTFIYLPGSTKQKTTDQPYIKTKIYCPQLDKNFESQVEAAEYFTNKKIWGNIKLKTAKLRINDVVRGYFDDYKGYTFIKID